MQTDQYNNVIPNDLVNLNLDDLLNHDVKNEQFEQIIQLDWYEADIHPRHNLIFVSANKLQEILNDYVIDFYGPENYGLERGGWNKIDNVLKRWSLEDGFYHA